jgi:hypothetical protein
LVRPRPNPDSANQVVFNNPDGMGMAFSEAWEGFDQRHPGHGFSREQKLEQVMLELADHPFLLREPEQAQALVAFRMRLLGY